MKGKISQRLHLSHFGMTMRLKERAPLVTAPKSGRNLGISVYKLPFVISLAM